MVGSIFHFQNKGWDDLRSEKFQFSFNFFWQKVRSKKMPRKIMVHFRLKFVVWISIFFEEGDLQHLIFDNISETFSRIFPSKRMKHSFLRVEEFNKSGFHGKKYGQKSKFVWREEDLINLAAIILLSFRPLSFYLPIQRPRPQLWPQICPQICPPRVYPQLFLLFSPQLPPSCPQF